MFAPLYLDIAALRSPGGRMGTSGVGGYIVGFFGRNAPPNIRGVVSLAGLHELSDLTVTARVFTA